MNHKPMKFIGFTSAFLVTSFFSTMLQARWYDDATLRQGDALFQQNCASCHKPDASGTTDWKKPDASGHYPPPPLNGTAHAWHHDLELLKQTIRDGGANLGGVMPPFKDQLSDLQIEAVIAYFQSRWPAEVYQRWEMMNQPDDGLPTLDSINPVSSKTKNK